MRASMLRWTGITASIIILGTLSAGLTASPRAATPAPQSTAADPMKVDPAHSGISFRVTHLGVSYIMGRFNTFEGSFTLDPDDLEACSITATAKAASIDTNAGNRDRHLKGPDFFDSQNQPDVTFKSTKWEKGATANHYRVTGDLTLLGRTKSITIDLEHMGTKTAPRFGKRTGLYSQFTIDRSDFGMKYGLDGGMVSDKVQLTVAFEGAVAQ